MTSQPATRLEPQTHSWPNQYPHPITGEYGNHDYQAVPARNAKSALQRKG